MSKKKVVLRSPYLVILENLCYELTQVSSDNESHLYALTVLVDILSKMVVPKRYWDDYSFRLSLIIGKKQLPEELRAKILVLQEEIDLQIENLTMI